MIRNNVAEGQRLTSDSASAAWHGTLVVLPGEYCRDLGERKRSGYIRLMTLVLLMVVLAFGLLYVAVVAEERQMQQATKTRKR
jgi:hypothetical protein